MGLKFEGSGDLLPFLQEAREQVNGLRVVHSQANASIQSDLKKTTEEAKQTNAQFNVASKLVVALAASAQQGLPALIRNLSEVADVSEVVASSLSAADKANFTSVNAGLREVAKNQNIVVEGIEEAKAARIDALVAAKKLTVEEGNLLKQVTAVVDTFKKLEKVKVPDVKLPGVPATLPAEKASSDAPDPATIIAQQRAIAAAYEAKKIAAGDALLAIEANTVAEKAAAELQVVLNAAQQKGLTLEEALTAAKYEQIAVITANAAATKAQEVAARSLAVADAAAIAQHEALTSKQQAAPDIAASLASAQQLRDAYLAAAEEAARIGESFGKDSAAYTQAATNVEKIRKELTASVAQGGPLAQRLKAAQVEAEKIARTSGINSKEFKAQAGLAAAIRVEIDKTNAALGVQVGELDNVRQQYRAALVAAQNLASTPGPEYDAALAEVARLKKLLDDTASSVRNLNPGDKVRAFTQLGNAIASGAQAIGGFAIAFGGNNQALQETLFKFQSALFALQGAQTFFKDFGDSLKDVRRVLGLETVEQIKNTVASEADIAVKGEQAVATRAVGTASTGAASGVKAFASALLSVPGLAIVAALAAAVALLYAFSKGSEEARKSYAELLDEIQRGFSLGSAADELDQAKLLAKQESDRLKRLDDFAAGKRKDAELTKEELADQLAQQDELDNKRIKNIELQQTRERDAFNELTALKSKAFDDLGNVNELDAAGKQRMKLIKALGLQEEATNAEILASFKQLESERLSSKLKSEADIFNILAKSLASANDLRQKELDDIKAKAKATRDIREQLADQIAAIEKALADKIRELESEEADPRRRLEIQKQVADELLANEERNLRRLIALEQLRVKVGTEGFQALSEAQKKAAADAIIEDGGGQLSTKQAEAFAAARLLIERDFLRKRVELQLEFDQVLADASGDAQVKELAALDALLVGREKKLRDAGATQAEIDADAAKQVLAVQEKLAKDRLALDEQTQLDLLGAQLAAASGNEALERAIQEKILAVKIEFAIKALALIEDNGEAENNARIAAAKRTIEELTAELGKLKKDIKPFRLSDLFDLEGEDADKFNAAAEQIGAAVLDIVRINNQARQDELDAQIANTDALIEDYRRRGDELQQQLENDLELNKQGLANNLDATLAAIEANKKAEAAALAEKKRIQAEKQKLARQQVIIDSISQASSLATSAAQTIQGLAGLPFGVGLITAFALVAQMYAFFAGFKAKLAAASQPQGLKTGTKSVQLNGAPDGTDTVPAMLTRDEAVVPVAKNRKHRGLVGAIIDDDFSKLTAKELEPILAQIDLTPLLSEHGIRVNVEAVGKVVTMNNTHRERVEKAQAVDMAGVERRLDALAAEVKGFRKQEGDKPEAVTLPDGTVRVKRPGHTEYIRP